MYKNMNIRQSYLTDENGVDGWGINHSDFFTA